MDRPVLVHVVTEKGHVYEPAKHAADKLHSVQKFNRGTGEQGKSESDVPQYQMVFGAERIKHGERDPKIVAITAAMPSGTSVDMFGKRFPERTFDVGIAEQHAVTFAAGLAADS